MMSASCDRRNCSPPGSSVLGILGGVLDWVALSFSIAGPELMLKNRITVIDVAETVKFTGQSVTHVRLMKAKERRTPRVPSAVRYFLGR